jgi:hypothetical protein
VVLILKMNWKTFVCGMVVGSALFSSVSFAAPAVVKMIVNGKEIHSEVPAQIMDGSTLIPARALAEALGAKVIWDEGNKRVFIESESYNQLMNEDVVVQLAGAAQRHYWHISNGGSGVGAVESFKVEGNDYRWMGSDLDTKEKFITYLEEIITPDQSEAYWKKLIDNGLIREINGKLAQPNADGGSLRNWNESKATLNKDESSKKTYSLAVPIGDTGEKEVHELQVQFIAGKGWRINSTLEFIK